MKDIHQELEKKGWHPIEIKKTIAILKKYTPKNFVIEIIYWIALFMAIIGSLVIAILLIPYILALRGPLLYSIIIILALSFGIFFDFILADLEKVDKHHYIIAGVFIPLFALICMAYMTDFTSYLILFYKINKPIENPYIISLVYIISFSFPHFYFTRILKKPITKLFKIKKVL